METAWISSNRSAFDDRQKEVEQARAWTLKVRRSLKRKYVRALLEELLEGLLTMKWKREGKNQIPKIFQWLSLTLLDHMVAICWAENRRY